MRNQVNIMLLAQNYVKIERKPPNFVKKRAKYTKYNERLKKNSKIFGNKNL